jgi:DNA-binding GntR family transcriptional regulator
MNKINARSLIFNVAIAVACALALPVALAQCEALAERGRHANKRRPAGAKS